MVQKAIMAVREPGGSSMNNIKKYVAAKYNVDFDKLSLAIAKYLKTAVALREMVQTECNVLLQISSYPSPLAQSCVQRPKISEDACS
jgi:hypothetical protein